jgi:hypothetical protein
MTNRLKCTKNLTIRLTDNDLEKLTMYSESKDQSLSQIIRKLIRQLPLESFKKDDLETKEKE